ncbi:MAG: hypothetical protein GXO78_06265 [Calditrichaeota bacterium]|nr:hypothetical protein [Calditrichota bacterium]
MEEALDIPIRVGLVLFLTVVLSSGCQRQSSPVVPAEQKRAFANVLYNQQLYRQAVAEYEDYLKNYNLDLREQANITYQIANIYFERLRDYENALAYYLRIKYLYPDSPLNTEVSKKIVACLERLQRSAEARQVMAQEAALVDEQKPQSRPEDVVAKIGQRTITLADLNDELRRLPDYMREQISQSRAAKVDFLKQYILQELLYDSAKRQGLDQDPEVIEGTFQAKKALMVQKLLEQEIQQRANLDRYTNKDVELYYRAHREKYAEKDEQGNIKRIPPFHEIAERVAQDFIREKQQEAYQQLVDRLMKAEQVVIYEDRIPE